LGWQQVINHGLQAAYAKAFRLNTPRAVLLKYRELCEPHVSGVMRPSQRGRERESMVLGHEDDGRKLVRMTRMWPVGFGGGRCTSNRLPPRLVMIVWRLQVP
jgi:hypothetical protein